MSMPPENPDVEAVLFDLYGTLIDIAVDTEPNTVWHRFSEELSAVGLSVPPDVLRARYDDLVAVERREHGHAFVLEPKFFHKLLSAAGRPLADPLVRHFGRRLRELTTRKIEMRPYTVPLLTTLQRSGCRVGLVSNTEEIVTEHDLEKLRLKDHFDTVVLSSSVGVKKPDPGIFQIALRRLGVSARNTLFVGDDHIADFEGARKAGLTPILLCPCGHQPPVRCTKASLKRILGALRRYGWRSGQLAPTLQWA
ncbi:MAG TPA: HAD family hydrolase [Terriglobales bacterium]|nr:HAD family hydrolase [Terriglobales bacterium]